MTWPMLSLGSVAHVLAGQLRRVAEESHSSGATFYWGSEQTPWPADLQPTYISQRHAWHRRVVPTL